MKKYSLEDLNTLFLVIEDLRERATGLEFSVKCGQKRIVELEHEIKLMKEKHREKAQECNNQKKQS